MQQDHDDNIHSFTVVNLIALYCDYELYKFTVPAQKEFETFLDAQISLCNNIDKILTIAKIQLKFLSSQVLPLKIFAENINNSK